MQLDQAWNTGFPQLYHYQPFDEERLSRTILGKELFFSNPAGFNDPWDCKPHYDSEAVIDAVRREEHIEEYVRITRIHGPNLLEAEVQRRASIYRENPAFFKSTIDDFSVGFSEALAQRYRVYCLSTHPDSELMWAHYSTQHTGICLEFTARSTLCSSAYKVSYLRHYPAFDFAETRGPATLMVMLTKSKAWKYESEYRLIADEKRFADPASDVLIANDHFVALPDETLKAIILGCLAPLSTLDKLRALIKKAPYPIELKRVVKMRNQYKLQVARA